MGKLNKVEIIIYDASALIMLASLLLLQTELRRWVPFIYGIGALCFAVMQFRAQTPAKTTVLRRLQRQQIIGAVIIVLTSIPLWMNVEQKPPLRHNEWVIFLAIGAWMELYTSFRIPKEMTKDNQQRIGK